MVRILRISLSIFTISILATACTTVRSYSYQFPEPIPENSRLLIIDDSNNDLFRARLANALMSEGYEIVADHERFRNINSRRNEVVASDSTYIEQFTQPIIDILHDQGYYDYVLRFSTIKYYGGFSRLNIEITDANNGISIGSLVYSGATLDVNVEKFLAELASDIKTGRVERWAVTDGPRPRASSRQR